MCAATILQNTNSMQVLLFEKNRTLGVKVAISGGGRCNVTTGITDKRQLLSKYIRGSKFLIPSFAAFPPDKVKDWFEVNGIPLKVEKDLRVFPVSNVGKDIVDLFEKIFQNKRMQVHFTEGIVGIEKGKNSNFVIKSQKAEYEVDAVVLTTGGNAYRHTGSTGDGYAFAKNFGHTTTELGPSLNSFEAKEDWCKELTGISFPEAKLEVTLSAGEKKAVAGPFLFTHFGVSGPATFAMAAHVAFEEINSEHPLILSISPFSKEHYDSWDDKLKNSLTNNGGKFIWAILKEWFPQRFVDKVLMLAEVSADKKCATVTKEERKRIVNLLSGKMSVTLLSRRPGDEFVTAGGINLSEVDSKTMRSKLNPDLYFAGEILDIDGLTGGFNLQAAWATGRMAGINIVKS
jgi:predicted Rossmann fold flavoprotein